jgi:hypothetical protein
MLMATINDALEILGWVAQKIESQVFGITQKPEKKAEKRMYQMSSCIHAALP